MKYTEEIRFTILIFITVILVYLLFFSHESTPQVIKNQTVIQEINRLLLPVYSKNATEADFYRLQTMVASDSYAANEVHEMTLLTKYREYKHVGHGLGFLYEYIKTGNQSICPGHALSHYYVWISYGEKEAASDALAEAKETFLVWERSSLPLSEDAPEHDKAFFTSLLTTTLSRIDAGNTSISDDERALLDEVPCVVS